MGDEESRFKTISTNELQVGMFVEDVGRSWLRHPWAKKSKLVTSQEAIDQLLEYGITEVVIDLAKSVKPRVVADQLEALKPEGEGERTILTVERRKQPREEPSPDPDPIVEELPQARQAYRRAMDVTREFIAEARAGRKIDVAAVRDSVEEMIDSLFRNRHALMALTNLRSYDEYTFTHSLNVAVLAMSVGRHFKMRRSELRPMGLGAIFHDIGKTGIPESILNKPGKLTEAEFYRMKEHPVIGARMIEGDKSLSPFVVDMVKHHHERLDGSGYPDGLSGGQLETHVIINGLADVYDALSSDRAYRKGLSPHEALHALFKLRAKQFPSILMDRFIQALGIYPAGTTVRLNTGETGVVFAVNQASLLKPQILLVLDPTGARITPAPLIDLNTKPYMDRDIAEVIDPKTAGVTPAEYLLDELNIK